MSSNEDSTKKRKLNTSEEPVGPWRREFSKTYAREYWFNTETGEKSWDRKENAHPHERVAVIIPFRDLSKTGDRMKQLNQFVPHMKDYLSAESSEFRIIVVEQSDDGRKFNRGKLLNIGFQIAVKEDCTIFIFHDVDLLPSQELRKYYFTRPDSKKPVHIARVWDRYNSNLKYFGGVVSFSRLSFESINGFPNNFWGWGGEDDELFKRSEKLKLTPIAPESGNLTDLENMNLKEKLNFLRENRILKCMNKNEVLDEHDATWRENGLADLKFAILDRRELFEDPRCFIVTVDCLLNGNHWTNLRAGINDSQL